MASLVLVIALIASNLWWWRQTSQTSVMRTVTLSGTETAPQASGTVIMSVDGDHGALVVDGLAVLDADHQYQLWLIKDGQRTSGGVFSVDDEGYAVLWVSAPASLSSFDAVGVTVEPAGGSPSPTGEKVLGGTL